MEIGPIAGIRPITTMKPSSPAPDLSGVFAVELRKQGHDEAPAHQRAARGLEDEESDDGAVRSADERSLGEIDLQEDPQADHSRVSFFA